MGDSSAVNIAKVDRQHRVILPDAEPGDVFQVETHAPGRRYLLTRLEAREADPFPRGSLVGYFTAERAAEEKDLLAGCSLRVA